MLPFDIVLCRRVGYAIESINNNLAKANTGEIDL